MNSELVLQEFKRANALLEGHFILSSGKHSRFYLQTARVFMYPEIAEKICKALAIKIREEITEEIDYIVSPAMGGVIVGYEMGRQLSVPAMFLERVDGQFQFRRGFALEPIKNRTVNVIMMEDIITTGLSSKEAILAIEAAGGRVVAAGCIIDRSAGEVDVGTKIISMAGFKIDCFDPESLPEDLKETPAVQLGSRNLAL